MPDRARFKDKAVLVSGASSGIGRATALALAGEGAQLVIAGRRRERLDEVAAECVAKGSAARVVTGDVRDEATCATWVAEAVTHFGGLDGLVNAAGVIGNGSIASTEPAEWDRVMDSNLRSVYLLSRAATAALIERRGGIVNVSSVAGPRPYAGLIAYCVSKAALDALTRCASLDLAPHGVRVNAVNPGVVVTELHTVTSAVADYPAFLERAKATHPLGRPGQPEEIAATILFLLSEESGWITGATVPIDGGRALTSLR